MKGLKIGIIIISSALLLYIIVGYLSSYMGWYGYEKWKYRKYSTTVQEAINRGTLVKKLNYRIDSFQGAPFPFEPFLEKGYKWGKKSSDETIILKNTLYPFQFSYNYKPNEIITIRLREDQINKFDSIGRCLTKPHLVDTVILEIGGENIKTGLVKVWE